MDESLLRPGGNCWRIERADRAALVVDAAAYFAAAREAMLAAERRIMLIGWDFDARIRIGEEEDGAPATIGDFILWLVERRPALQVYLLRWDFGAVKSIFRGTTPLTLLRWWRHKRIHARLDSMHPPGASHHQKIVVVDDCLAFCGGIDMTGGRWDTPGHRDSEPRRLGPGGKPYDPWHDATMALEGPVAAALGELARYRWRCAGGGELEPVRAPGRCWPASLAADFEGAELAIARTQPDHGTLEESREIEALYLDLIGSAERFIYAESQYFASRRIAEAIARRVRAPDGPEIVLVNPESAEGWLEQKAMDSARARLWRAIGEGDPHHRFRIYHPFTAGGTPIYVHAKIMIVDDRVLRVGSSNWNNRSLRLDTECDVALDAALPANGGTAARIGALRDRLMAEHLGVAPDAVERAYAESGSLVATVERLRGTGRTLRPYAPPDLSKVEEAIADTEILDPEGPDEMFEPLARRGLFRRLPWPGRR